MNHEKKPIGDKVKNGRSITICVVLQHDHCILNFQYSPFRTVDHKRPDSGQQLRSADSAIRCHVCIARGFQTDPKPYLRICWEYSSQSVKGVHFRKTDINAALHCMAQQCIVILIVRDLDALYDVGDYHVIRIG